ncbi:MAG: MarR family winged helix-turn-helix transcriptional regulator [Peptostreptococcaceae bacterium]
MKRECIIAKIRTISLQSDKFLNKRIKEENLPILRNHIPLFYILPYNGEKILFNELAKTWDISKSSLSDIVNKYESLNLVTKCSCTDDKRSVYIGLTKNALYIKDKLDEIEDEFLDILLKNFTNEEREIYEIYIKKSLSNIINM